MNDQQLTIAYGFAAIVLILITIAAFATQQFWILIFSQLAIIAWLVVGFVFDIYWKDDK